MADRERSPSEVLKTELDSVTKVLERQLLELGEWKKRVERIGPKVGINPEDFKDIWPLLSKLSLLEALDRTLVIAGGTELPDKTVKIIFPKHQE